MSNPAVSIIIPTYKSSSTIRAALDSVAAQTFTDYEVIVVDDASQDDTVRVVQEWVQDYQKKVEGLQSCSPARFQVLPLARNLGPAGARNRGAAEVHGEWIAFLDGDDVWMPWKLADQLAVIAAHPEAGMVCGGVQSFRTRAELATALKLPVPDQSEIREITLTDFIENNPVATSTVIVRRGLLNELGGFDPRFRGPEDLDLWLRIASKTRIMMTTSVVSLYRYVPSSLSMDDRRFLPEVLRVLDKAFGDGGALAKQRELRKKALSTQYWNASWMAFGRADKATALGYWAKAWWLNRDRHARVKRPWMRLLLRYVVTLPKSCGGCG